MATCMRRSSLAAGLLLVLAVWWGLPPAACRAAETQTGDLTVWADYAGYRVGDDPSITEVEFCFAFKRHELSFLREPGGQWIAEVGLWVQVLNLQDQPITDTIAAHFGCAVTDSADAASPDFKVFYALPVQLPPGSYHAKIIAMDMYGEAGQRKVGELTLPVIARDFSSASLMLSDLKLAYDIDVVEQPPDSVRQDVLVRNQRKVYPDPRGILSRNRPQLYFYGEVYNLQFEPGGENVYELCFRFLTADSVTVKDFGTRAYKKPGTSSVLATGVPTGDLPEGKFLLEVAVTDPATGLRAVATKPFTVLLEQPAADSLTVEQAQKMRDVILYLAKKEDLIAYDQLGLFGKRNFLREFWKRKADQRQIPVDEFKQRHFNLFNYANEKYSTTFTKENNGWKTDRGRILITYGPPDEIQRYPSSMSEKPWEEWYYFKFGDQGEVYFIFQDEDGFGDLKLVHSTARGEKRDPTWERKVQDGRLMR